MFSATPKPSTSKSKSNTPYGAPSTISRTPGPATGSRLSNRPTASGHGTQSQSTGIFQAPLSRPSSAIKGRMSPPSMRQEPITPYRYSMESSRSHIDQPGSVFSSRMPSSVTDISLSHQKSHHQQSQQPQQGATPNVLLSSDTLSVHKIGQIPNLIFRALLANQWDQSNVSGAIDDTSGYAALALPDRCYVWHALHKQNSFNQCLEFGLIRSSETDVNSLMTAFIPSPLGNDHQPGLVLCSLDGTCRFWENIVFGPTAYSETHIPLTPDDIVTRLEFFEPMGCVVATERGCLFLLPLWDASGSSAISVVPLSRSQGVLSRVTSLFGYGGDKDSGAATPVVDGPVRGLISTMKDSTARYLYILSESKIQKWSLNANSTPTLLTEASLIDAIKTVLESSDDSQYLNLNVRLEDIACLKGDTLVVLVAFSEINVTWGYCLVFLEERNGQFAVVNFKQTKLERETNQLNKRAHLVIFQERVVFVMVPDKIVICISDLNSDFEEMIPFSSSSVVAYASQDASLSPEHVTLQIIALEQNAGLLGVDVILPVVAARAAVKEAGPEQSTQTLRSKIEQAVYFGGAAEWTNPIAFDLGHNGSGDLSLACMEVSSEILNSTSDHFRGALDVKAHLAERLHRLEQLIAFLHANHAVEKLPIQTRVDLRSHAEKLAAGLSLWDYQNELFSKSESNNASSDDVLKLAIQNFMNGEDDFIRNFFRYKLGLLGEFLAYIQHSFDSPQPAYYKLRVVEANKIIVTTLSAAYGYRQEYSSRYSLELDTEGEIWTSDIHLIELLESQFERTELAVKDISDIYPEIPTSSTNLLRDISSNLSSLKNHLRNHLAELGELLLGSLHERVAFLAKNPSRERDFVAMKEQNQRNHERVLAALASQQRTDHAFRLAEKHRNFKALVDLWMQDPAQHDHRIKSYMDAFGPDFANCFNDSLLKRGKYAELLKQSNEYDRYLDMFLQSENVSWLSWIHDVKLANFSKASATLWNVGEQAQFRNQQMLSFSLSKLAAIEAVDDLDAFEASGAGQMYQRAQEFILLQKGITKMFEERIEEYKSTRATSVSSSFGIEDGIPVVYDKWFAKNLRNRPVTESLVRSMIKKMLQGKKLSPADMIELLSLQSATNDAAMYWISAMELLIRYLLDTNSSEAEFYVNCIWRRTWLSERWDQIREKSKSCSDDELRSLISNSNVYKVIETVLSQNNEQILLNPDTVRLDFSIMPLATRYPDLDNVTLSSLQNEYEVEHGKFLELNHEACLSDFYNESCRLAESAMPSDAL